MTRTLTDDGKDTRMAGAPHLHYPGSTTPRGPEDLYTSPPPWDIGRPQPAFLTLAEAGAIQGRVLDVGCGTGEHVLMCAALGLDAGLFHIFNDDDRTAYVGSLRSVLEPGGRYYMLCFSDQQAGEWGRVHKVTQDEIKASFAEGWRVDSIEPATIDIATDPYGIRAW